MIEEALSHLVKGIVDHPDDVSVEQRAPRGNRNDRRGATLEVRVNPEDLGRVIGRKWPNGKSVTNCHCGSWWPECSGGFG